jgi:hypothetical protein
MMPSELDRPAKEPAKAAAAATRARRFLRKNLEGWQPGLVAVVIAAAVTWLVVPWAAEPEVIPEPRFDHAAVARAAARDRELAKKAAGHTLDTEVRALGDAIRAYGRVDFDEDADRIREARTAVARATARAVAIDFAGTVELRAFETEAFLASLGRFARTGVIDDDLLELGGGYVRSLRHNQLGAGHDAASDDARLRALLRARRDDVETEARVAFKRRWNDLTGVGGQPGQPNVFDPGKDELLAVYALELRRPPALGVDVDAKDVASEALRGHNAASFRRKRIAAIVEIDPAYPRELALGVVNYQAGDFREAMRDFTVWLERHPDGPWTLRAQNYALAAAARQTQGP